MLPATLRLLANTLLQYASFLAETAIPQDALVRAMHSDGRTSFGSIAEGGSNLCNSIIGIASVAAACDHKKGGLNTVQAIGFDERRKILSDLPAPEDLRN